jgi:hypothetical protein
MKLKGTYNIRSSREDVFDFITNPNKIGKCLPDLKSLEMQGEDQFTATVRFGIGFVKGDFTFRVTIAERKRPTHVLLTGYGTGTGSEATMDIHIELHDIADGTSFAYEADVKFSGMIAGLAQRLIERFVEKTVNNLFECIRHELEK